MAKTKSKHPHKKRNQSETDRTLRVRAKWVVGIGIISVAVAVLYRPIMNLLADQQPEAVLNIDNTKKPVGRSPQDTGHEDYSSNQDDTMWQQCADQMKLSKSLTFKRTSISNGDNYVTYFFDQLDSFYISQDGKFTYVHFWIHASRRLLLKFTSDSLSTLMAMHGVQSLICRNSDYAQLEFNSPLHLMCENPLKLLDDCHKECSSEDHEQHQEIIHERKKMIEKMPQIPNNSLCPQHCLCRMVHCFSMAIFCYKSTNHSSSHLDNFIENTKEHKIYIQTLDISFSQLRDFPREICNLATLKHFYFLKNKLHVFPRCIQKLRALIKIDISFNHLKQLHFPYKLTNLKCLLAHNNMITNFSFLQPHKNQFILRNLEILNISSNQLENLNFSLPHKLLHFDVSRNHLNGVQSSVLQTLWKLVSLHLSHNKLTTLDSNLFLNNHELKLLDLSNNKLQALNFKIPQSVQQLFLENNEINTIISRVFDQAFGLRQLSLSNNQIQLISSDTLPFTPLKNLEELKLDNNLIKSLDEMSFSFESLIKLDLSKNRIKKVDLGAGLFKNSKLHMLFLQKNEIIEILETEPSLSELKKLNISFNRLQAMPLEIVKLGSLIDLDLSHNHIQAGVWKFFFQTKTKKKNIKSVSRCQIKLDNFFSQVGRSGRELGLKLKLVSRQFLVIQDRIGLSIKQFRNELHFRVLTNSTDMGGVDTSVQLLVNLQHNNITNILDLLPGIDISLAENINLLSFFQLGYNPIRCDCRLYPYLKHMYDIHQQLNSVGLPLHIMVPQMLPPCHYPTHLRTLNLSDPQVLESVVAQLHCDYKVEISNRDDGGCLYLFFPYNDTLIIDCSNQKLKAIPPILSDTFSHPNHEDIFKPENKILLLTGNNITNLNAFDVQYLDSFKTIDLSHCNISSIDEYTWLVLFRKVSQLFLNDNNLTYLPIPGLTSVTDDLPQTVPVLANLKEIHLYNNPWNCSCDKKWIKTWLLKLMDKKVLVKPQLVKCAFPDWNRGKLIHDLPLDHFCDNPNTSKIIEIAVLVFGTVVFILFAVYLIYKVLYHIRHYLFRQYNVHPFDKDECIGEDMLYDAFISYSESNSNWVDNRLLVRLSPPYKLCNHKTDFIPGRYIDQNIFEAVKRSKRTIVVLTTEYVTSPYCMEEFKQAYNFWIEYMHKHRLVVLKHRNVNENELEDTVLKLFLRKYKVINMNWNMWNNLQYAMPLKPINM